MSLGEDVVPHTASTLLSTSPSAQSPNALTDVQHSKSKDEEMVKEMEKEQEDVISLTGKCSDVVSRIKQSAASYLCETQGHGQGQGQGGSADSSDQSAREGSVKKPRNDQGELLSSLVGGSLGNTSGGDGGMQMDVEIGIETGTATGVITIDQDDAIISTMRTSATLFNATTPIVAPRAGLTPQIGTLDPSPLRYRLNAVVRHIGSDAFTGHYICDTAVHETPATPPNSINRLVDVNEGEHASSRKSTAAAWSRNNDSLVNSVDEESVLSEMDTPYIFFYTRI
jgi:hypothetical protein